MKLCPYCMVRFNSIFTRMLSWSIMDYYLPKLAKSSITFTIYKYQSLDAD